MRKGQVVIIDEFTGRMMEGRRYSEGLHQALEAKEGVQVQPENQTLASITFQNYFRLYDKLAGMTGTALTEAAEFQDIYKLEMLEIPTHRPMVRIDSDDEVYRTAKEKYKAIITLIQECHQRDQPILVGTTSIEKSETLSEMLKPLKVPHQVLNARYHEQEAGIVAQAGVPGAVTIATNMAGAARTFSLAATRPCGSRIGSSERKRPARSPRAEEIEAERAKINADVEEKKQIALAAGGLYVLGTERHESRRIDNQLRGRSGRQGRPRRLQILPLARRRPDAHLRVRAHGLHAAQARHPGGRGHRPSLDQPRAGKGSAKGRGAQLRYAQKPAQVRRRDERSAQGDLRAAHRPHARRDG